MSLRGHKKKIGLWANPKYSFTIDQPKENIEAIVLDPSNLMADIDKSNNYYVADEK